MALPAGPLSVMLVQPAAPNDKSYLTQPIVFTKSKVPFYDGKSIKLNIVAVFFTFYLMKSSSGIKFLTFQSSFMTSEKCCMWFRSWAKRPCLQLKCFASNQDRPMRFKKKIVPQQKQFHTMV